MTIKERLRKAKKTEILENLRAELQDYEEAAVELKEMKIEVKRIEKERLFSQDGLSEKNVCLNGKDEEEFWGSNRAFFEKAQPLLEDIDLQDGRTLAYYNI